MRTGQTISNRYTITAGVTSYQVTFPLYEDSDVKVYLSQDGGTTERVLTRGLEYGVTRNGTLGGTITLTSGVADAGDIIVLASNLPYTQELDLNGVSTIDTEATEKQLDRTTQQIQQLAGMINRAVLTPATSTAQGMTASDVLAASNRATAAATAAEAAQASVESTATSVIAAVNAKGVEKKAEVTSEGASQISAIGEYTNQQLARIENVASLAEVTEGIGYAEGVLAITETITAGTQVQLPDGLQYIVGLHHIRVSYDGVTLSPSFFTEVGTTHSLSSVVTFQFNLVSGMELDFVVMPVGKVDVVTVQESLNTLVSSAASSAAGAESSASDASSSASAAAASASAASGSASSAETSAGNASSSASAAAASAANAGASEVVASQAKTAAAASASTASGRATAASQYADAASESASAAAASASAAAASESSIDTAIVTHDADIESHQDIRSALTVEAETRAAADVTLSSGIATLSDSVSQLKDDLLTKKNSDNPVEYTLTPAVSWRNGNYNDNAFTETSTRISTLAFSVPKIAYPITKRSVRIVSSSLSVRASFFLDDGTCAFSDTQWHDDGKINYEMKNLRKDVSSVIVSVRRTNNAVIDPAEGNNVCIYVDCIDVSKAINIAPYLDWIGGKSYNENGELVTNNGAACTNKIKLAPGVRFYLTSYGGIRRSVRTNFWNGDTLVKSDTTIDLQYNEVPEGCNQTSFAVYYDDCENPKESKVHIWNSKFDNMSFLHIPYEQKISILEESIDNYFNYSKEFIKNAESGNFDPFTGALASSNTRCYCDTYFKCKSGSVVYILAKETINVRLCCYDSNKLFISDDETKNWHDTSESFINCYKYKIPQNAVFVRICFRNNDNSVINPSSVYDSIIYYSKICESNTVDITEYYGKRISILGDSLSTFGGNASDSNRYSDGTYTYAGNRCRYPQSNLLTDVNLTYWMRLISHFGMNLGVNESWAGSRVSNSASSDSGDVGPNRHIASTTRISHLGENGTPDLILVNAGTNDIGASVTIGTFNTESPMDLTQDQINNLPVATFADAYRTMLIRLQYYYPTSQILVLLPNYTTTYYSAAKEDQYCEIIKEACDYFGIKWLDMRTCGVTMYNKATYLPDGIHYNSKGTELLYRNIMKFMKNSFSLLG